MYGLRGPSGLNMVNQAFIIVIAYRPRRRRRGEGEEGEGENTRDRSVPDGSDNYCNKFIVMSKYPFSKKEKVSSSVIKTGYNGVGAISVSHHKIC